VTTDVKRHTVRVWLLCGAFALAAAIRGGTLLRFHEAQAQPAPEPANVAAARDVLLLRAQYRGDRSSTPRTSTPVALPSRQRVEKGQPRPDSDVHVPRVAVLGMVDYGAVPSDEQQTADTLLRMTEMCLLEMGKVPLVDRTEVARVLREHELSLTLVRDPAQRIRLGQMLHADFLVWGTAQTATGKTAFVGLRIVESLTGTVRGIATGRLDPAAVPELAAEWAREVAKVATGKGGPASVTLAVTPFENRSRFTRLAALECGLCDLLTRAICQQGNCRVLQRTNMQGLLDELQWIRSGFIDPRDLPAGLPSRETSYLVSGHFKEDPRTDELWVSVRLAVTRMSDGETVVSQDRVGRIAEIDRLCARLAVNVVQRLLGGASDREAVPGNGSEADALMTLVYADAVRVWDLSDAVQVVAAADGGRPLVWPEEETLLDPKAPRLYQALKVASRLECVLFLRPDDLKATALLGACYAIRVPELWRLGRSIQLLEHVAGTAPDSELGKFAHSLIPKVYADAYHQEGQNAEYKRLSAEAYVRLGDMRSLWEAHRAYLELKDEDKAMACLVAAAPLPLDKSPRWHRDHADEMEYVAQALLDLCRETPAGLDAAVAVLSRWSESASPYLRVTGQRWLGQLYRQAKEPAKGAEVLTAAVGLCVQQTDNWFKWHEYLARADAALCYGDMGQPERGISLITALGPGLRKAYAADAGVCLALGELHVLSGNGGKAIAVYQQFKEWFPAGCRQVRDRLDQLRRQGDTAAAPPRALGRSYKGRLFGRSALCMVGDDIWVLVGVAGGGGAPLVRFRPETESWEDVDNRFCSAWDLDSDGTYLWIATEHGVWRRDVATGEWRHWDTQAGLPDNRVCCVTAHDKGAYLGVGCPYGPGGLVHIDAGGAVRTFEQDGAPDMTAISILVQESRMLVGSRAGLHSLDRQTATWSHLYTEGYMTLFAGRDTVYGIKEAQAPVIIRNDTPFTKLDEALSGCWSSSGGRPRLEYVTLIEDGECLWLFGKSASSRCVAVAFHFDRKSGRFRMWGPKSGLALETVHQAVLCGDTFWLAGWGTTDTHAVLVKVTKAELLEAPEEPPVPDD